MVQAVGYGRGTLPVEMTTFVGRRREIAEVKDAVAASRLVTLTGVGGVGKSRLALHVGMELYRAFPDGVWLVELANVREPSLVAQTVAVELDLRDQSLRDPETVLAAYLADKSCLLVLDNCEHLLDTCCELVNTLLMAAPTLHVLVTSREPLRSSGEHVWSVPPMSLPGPGEPVSHRHEALTLFEERVTHHRPRFTLTPENRAVIARLCRRLDGLPLAIELAAVRMRVLSAQQILDRLEDRFRLLAQGVRDISPRHQTLRATVDWSFELCSQTERAVWARCSVFSGPFDLDAAEYVCSGDGLSETDVFMAVAGLVDKSVLVWEGGRTVRYRMLETIRQYGHERLGDFGDEDTLRRRHRDYYLRIAEQIDADSSGPRQGELIEDLSAERDNMTAALDYCFSVPGEARVGLHMATALWFCWIGCGFLRSGRYWLDRGLAEDREVSAARARALWINGWITFLQGDQDASRVLYLESLDLARALDDEAGVTYALESLGTERAWAGDLQHGTDLLDEALDRHRKSGHWTALALMTFETRAQAAGLAGDTATVMGLLQECRSICEPLGERWALSWMEWTVGITWWSAGQPDKAVGYLRQALRHKDRLRDKMGIACCINLLAWAAIGHGDAHRAAVLFGAVTKLWEPIGQELFGMDMMVAWSEAERRRTREALGARAFDAALKEGQALGPAEVVAYALDIKTETEPSGPATVLTKREWEVAELVAQGLSNREIANRLVISRRTAESHLDHILTKLGFTSRTQIAVWVAEQDTPRR
jgi:predicted ATPase/DNA-binding CsgD family transcriptional regulator